jgi:hypothetical protein
VNLSETSVLLGHYAVYVGSCVPKLSESLSKNKIYLSGKNREDFQELSPINYGILLTVELINKYWVRPSDIGVCMYVCIYIYIYY